MSRTEKQQMKLVFDCKEIYADAIKRHQIRPTHDGFILTWPHGIEKVMPCPQELISAEVTMMYQEHYKDRVTCLSRVTYNAMEEVIKHLEKEWKLNV